MRALITGGSGQLGSDFATILGADARAYTHDELDISDSAAVDRAFAEVQPEIVFNCAAFHNLDECEADPRRAFEVNVEAVRDLARRDAKLVHISTNYVFDGRRHDPYAENDLPAPRSMYALSKLAGEHAALAYGERTLIVRTAGLYGLNGSASKGGNFVQRMLRRAAEQGSLTVVSDQRLQPTFTWDLATAVLAAAHSGAEGVVHLTAAGTCSWYEFTKAIIERAGLDIPVEPAATVVAAGGIDRPLNGVLARPRSDALGLSQLRDWREALGDYMTRSGLGS